MKKTSKQPLALSRETVKALGTHDLDQARGGLYDTRTTCPPPTSSCPSVAVCPSLFDSCYRSDCCLMQP